MHKDGMRGKLKVNREKEGLNRCAQNAAPKSILGSEMGGRKRVKDEECEK